MKSKFNFERWWVTIYAIAIVVLPPIHFHDKLYFWAEILLLPLLAVFAKKVLLREVRWPPRPLLAVLAATTAAFIAGRYRGDLGHQFSIYPFNATDEFALSRDGVSFVRWCLIFSTPWLVRESLRESKLVAGTRCAPSPPTYRLFMQALKYGVFISALLSFAHRAHVISLADWGYFTEGLTWAGRSHGTFTAPLEAGMVYALMTLFLCLALLKRFFARSDDPFTKTDAVILVVCTAALLLTKTGTSFVAMCIAFLGAMLFSPLRHKKSIIALTVGGVFIFLMCLPSNFILLKWNDFIARPQTWGRWVHAVPARPSIALFGIGFSQLIVDNSFLTILIKGGLFLVAALAFWLTELSRKTPGSLKFLFVFWAVSWLALDSIGYWGIGRIMWTLWGLCLLEHDRIHALNRQS